MRNTRLATCLLLLSVLSLPLAQPGGRGGHGHDDDLEFRARLTGAEEVPPAETRTRGKARFEVNEERTRIRYELEVAAKDDVGLLAVAGAHIHCAPRGSNGPVVAFLAGPITGGVNGKFEIEATLTDANITNPACGATIAELVDAMLAGGTYVNVHSRVRPSGETRGQIEPEDEDEDR